MQTTINQIKQKNQAEILALKELHSKEAKKLSEQIEKLRKEKSELEERQLAAPVQSGETIEETSEFRNLEE